MAMEHEDGDEILEVPLDDGEDVELEFVEDFVAADAQAQLHRSGLHNYDSSGLSHRRPPPPAANSAALPTADELRRRREAHFSGGSGSGSGHAKRL